MAGAEPRFGTTATYMRSEYHKYLASASTTNNCYDYINRLPPSIFNALTQIHGKVQTRGLAKGSPTVAHGTHDIFLRCAPAKRRSGWSSVRSWRLAGAPDNTCFLDAVTPKPRRRKN